MSFARKNRLNRKEDFAMLFAQGRKVSHRSFLAIFAINQSLEARLGLIISKQKVPRAIDRNRLRRLIRERFRLQKEGLKGLDIIVLMRSECIPLTSNEELKIDIDNLWQTLIKSVQKR